MLPTPEYKLLKPIMRLLFLLGILIGVWLILEGMLMYNMLPLSEGIGIFHLDSATITKLLGPYQCILLGTIILLVRKVWVLHIQYLQSTNGTGISTSDLGWLSRVPIIMGSFFLGAGCLSLILDMSIFPDPVLSENQQLWFVILISACLLPFLFVALYLVIRDSRRVQQKEQEWKRLHQGQTLPDLTN